MKPKNVQEYMKLRLAPSQCLVCCEKGAGIEAATSTSTGSGQLDNTPSQFDHNP